MLFSVIGTLPKKDYFKT